jgi:hypothetical protein
MFDNWAGFMRRHKSWVLGGRQELADQTLNPGLSTSPKQPPVLGAGLPKVGSSFVADGL